MPLEPVPEEVAAANLVIKGRTLHDPEANIVDAKGQVVRPDEARRHVSAARDPQGNYPKALHKINPAWVAAQQRGEPKTDPKTGQHINDPKEDQRTLMVRVVDEKDEKAKRKQGWLGHDELVAAKAFEVVAEKPVDADPDTL